MRALNHITALVTDSETGVPLCETVARVTTLQPSHGRPSHILDICMLSYTVILDSGVSHRNFRVSGPIAEINPYACILFPIQGVMSIPLL